MRRSSRQLKAAVQRGAKFLDERRPSWFTKINTTKLDLANCDLCVLGQLYDNGTQNGYYHGLEILNGAVQKDPARFGFEAGREFEYEEITKLWRAEIAARRKARRAAA